MWGEAILFACYILNSVEKLLMNYERVLNPTYKQGGGV